MMLAGPRFLLVAWVDGAGDLLLGRQAKLVFISFAILWYLSHRRTIKPLAGLAFISP